ncbi:50S ribosomal protein L22 [Patescibacteria group bacterium]|nr:50S ribosomal protein L22 [Patescibacteria group bacterium]
MEIIAKAKFIRISPKKVRPLLKDLRQKNVDLVLASLRYTHTKAGRLLYKLIASAAANATNNYNLKADNLKIKTLTANDGPRFKRHWMRSHGSSDVILKRNAHLAVVLEEIKPTTTPIVKKQAKPITKTTPADPTNKSEVENKEVGGGGFAGDNIKAKKSGGSGLKRIFPRTTNK